MFRTNKIFLLTVVLLACVVTWASASNTVELRGVLGGTVIADQLIRPGSTVREGAVLVMVETITGTAAAVRATTDGTIVEVLVKPGDRVKTGQVLVTMTPASK